MMTHAELDTISPPNQPLRFLDNPVGLLLSVVVPVYNEAQAVPTFIKRTVPVLEKIGPYEIIFVLDPCSDNTEEVISREIEKNRNIRLIVLSRRFGQPSATISGILNCRGKYCVIIDVDLQDPPELITELYQKTQESYEVVYAQRRSRKGETLIKRAISYLGYKVINCLAQVSIPENTGDFRIISRRVIEELRRLPEGHGFLRGLVALVGFKQGSVLYDRDARLSGQSKYNRLTGSFKIGFNGLVGFSSYPLSIVLWLGFVMAFLACSGAVYLFVSKLIFHSNYPLGFASMLIAIFLLGGVQLVSIGILGEYIGRIYDEVRGRPKYIVDRVNNMDLVDSRGVPDHVKC